MPCGERSLKEMRIDERMIHRQNSGPGDNGHKGLITSWQDYAVNDGYGLRLLIFLKGCPLRCKWCQNPEAVNPCYEIGYHSLLCQRCGKCMQVCPVEGAIIDPIANEDKTRRINQSKCIRCGICCEACSHGALDLFGKWVTVESLVDKVERLIPFMRRSDRGGVTISGGEPLFQPEFTWNLLKSSRELGICTAIETCGLARYEVFNRVAEQCDLIMYDIKHMNDQMHREGTGQSNKQILENLARFVSENSTECVVRLPLIPGFNDSEENVSQTAEFLKSLKRPPRLDLLPFNELASSKYKVLGLELEYQYAKARTQPEKTLHQLVNIARSYGLEVTTEGLW